MVTHWDKCSNISVYTIKLLSAKPAATMLLQYNGAACSAHSSGAKTT